MTEYAWAQITSTYYQFYPQLFDTISGPAKDLSPEERISAEEIMKHPWLQDSQVIRRANALMATQLRGSKRLVEELYVEVIPYKRARVGEPVSVFRTSLSVFRTPLSSTVSASP